MKCSPVVLKQTGRFILYFYKRHRLNVFVQCCSHHVLCIDIQASAHHPHELHVISLGCLHKLLLCF